MMATVKTIETNNQTEKLWCGGKTSGGKPGGHFPQNQSISWIQVTICWIQATISWIQVTISWIQVTIGSWLELSTFVPFSKLCSLSAYNPFLSLRI